MSSISFAENINFTGNLTLTEKKTPSNGPDYTFLSSLALALIPIGAGAFVTTYATNSWQKKKEQIQINRDILLDQLKIKRDILSDYDQSFKKEGVILDTFVIRMYETYLVYKDDGTCVPAGDDYKDVENHITGYIKFPKNKNQQPLKKFSLEYTRYLKNVDSTAFVGNRLFSSLRLFYENSDDIIKKLKDIDSKLNNGMLFIDQMIRATNGAEFIKFYNMYWKLSKSITNDMEAFELGLVKLKIK